MTTDPPVEVLQASSLEDYPWPEQDPHAVEQRTRARTDADLALVRRCLESAAIKDFDEYRRAKTFAGRLPPTTDRVLDILSRPKFQVNPPARVRQEKEWRERVQRAVDAHAPIEIVYPQFCVIPNAPKRYTNMGPAAGEDCTIEFFKLIDRHVREFHEPGVRFHVLADASLYASAFQTHQTEVDAYYESLQQRLRELDATECVFLYDYSELLRKKCRNDYQRLYYAIAHKVWRGDALATLLPGVDLKTLRRSVRCSINTRRFQLRHDDHRRLFGPENVRAKDNPYYQVIENMTDIAFRELITIRLACGEIDIASRLWPGALRATCHKGPKNGRWALGLKVYPEHYGSCKLLPYHGMPVITNDMKGMPRLEIEPEVLLRGRDDLVRVTSDGLDEVYAYVALDIDRALGAFTYTRPQGMRSGEEYSPEAYR